MIIGLGSRTVRTPTREERTVELAVFGAGGPTGLLLTRRALDAGHRVTAVTRRPADFPFTAPGLTTAGGDVRDPDVVRAAIAGSDAVVSTIGVPYSRKPITVYSAGITTITRAMADLGVRRLVCVSSRAVDPTPAPGDGPFERRVVDPLLRLAGRTLYTDMLRMEDVVRATDLEWTVLRPNGLFDATTTSDYLVSPTLPAGRFTARPDLADALLREAEHSHHPRRTAWVVTTTGVPTTRQIIAREAFGIGK